MTIQVPNLASLPVPSLQRNENFKYDHDQQNAIVNAGNSDSIESNASAAERNQMLRQHSQTNRRLLFGDLVTKSRQSAGMANLVRATLTPTPPGKTPTRNEEAWATLHDFDSKRCAARISGAIPGEEIFHEVKRVAMDTGHACHEDAVLLLEIMTRPVDESTPPLEHYLAQKIETSLCLDPRKMEILADPDFRTFNSIQPGLALSTLEYNSIGRTLLYKGATNLIGIPSAPADKPNTLTEKQVDRQGRLERSVFSFPKHAPEGETKLTMSDFDAMIDPLDDRDVYESPSR